MSPGSCSGNQADRVSVAFGCVLLRAAKHVTACDFMEVSIAENRL
jgi:hypothetical protein